MKKEGIKMISEKSTRIYENAIIIDATCPLASHGKWYESWIKGGVTAISPTVAYGNIDTLSAFHKTAEWLEKLHADSRLLFVEKAEDIMEAKENRKLGIILAFQTTTPFATNPDLVRAFYKLGIRITLLAYNQRNFVGDGCEERTDCGLSNFGIRYIRKCNECGILLDLSHTGYRTAMETIELSEDPVAITHSNPRAVYNSPRNIGDDLMLAVAKKGGVIGMNGFPAFLGNSSRPSMDTFLEHLRYVVDLVGVNHVGLGIDYYEYMAGVASDNDAHKMYNRLIQSGTWTAKTYPAPPWYYPEGIELPEKMPNLAGALVRSGYSEEEIRKILGLNFVRLFDKVWR